MPDEFSGWMDSGGLTVTSEMQSLISKPGYLSIRQGGQKLRELYSHGMCLAELSDLTTPLMNEKVL